MQFEGRTNEDIGVCYLWQGALGNQLTDRTHGRGSRHSRRVWPDDVRKPLDGSLSSAEHRITSRESDDRLIKLNLYSFFSLVTVDTFKAPGSLRKIHHLEKRWREFRNLKNEFILIYLIYTSQLEIFICTQCSTHPIFLSFLSVRVSSPHRTTNIQCIHLHTAHQGVSWRDDAIWWEYANSNSVSLFHWPIRGELEMT